MTTFLNFAKDLVHSAKLEQVSFCARLQILCTMARKILTYGGYFEAFMETLTEKVQEKFNTDCSS